LVFTKENIFWLKIFNIFENNIINAVVAKVLGYWYTSSVGVGGWEGNLCLWRGKERVDKFQMEHKL
jgi:hypothetical protein